MGISIHEKLSAYADDELGDFETRRLTDEVLKSEVARRRLEHYQVIGAALRDEPAQAFEGSFSAGVMAKIDALPDLQVTPGEDAGMTAGAGDRAGVPWVKILAGGAIAASVALISLFTLRSIDSELDSGPVVAQQAGKPETAVIDTAPVLAQTAPPADLAKTVSTAAVAIPKAEPIPPVLDNSANERLLSGYLATHAEHAAHHSVLPHARMMGFDFPEDK